MTLWPRIAISPTSPGGDVLAVVVDDLHLDAGDRGADRAGLALAVVGWLNEATGDVSDRP
jgi:hypothetical protein